MSLVRNGRKDGSWRNVYIHKECGTYFEFPHNNSWFVSDEPCPVCGGPLHSYISSDRYCEPETAKWVSTATWYKPITWGNGYWQHRGDE